MGTEAIALLAIFLPHAVGGAYLGWRLMPRDAREEIRGWFRDDDGGTPRPAPVAPRGGGGSEPPLPTAAPSAVRLREPGRLADRLPAPPRRPRHPARPAEPARTEEPAGR
ncbi:hypothetical protein [Patulibacter sp. SYSU D01012]|uniref:hypothetical protein n=1 Tax=Patulibacter sp. SYSU D01012 TaxID=2817381 RepID=UPI001B302F28|nr:hypothetical protein [Patulibacter sp. SYSU D01012]